MQDFPTFFQSFSINQRAFASVLSPVALGYLCVFYVIVLFLRPFPRHRMPVIFFAWHSWHFCHFSARSLSVRSRVNIGPISIHSQVNFDR